MRVESEESVKIETTRGGALLALSRGVAALVVVMALVAQIEDQVVRGAFNPATYFSYFSIQTSIANALALGAFAVTPFFLRRTSQIFPVIRGSLVAYAIVTASVYNLLLREARSEPDAEAMLMWPIDITHIWIPLYLVIEWMLDPGRDRLRWSFFLWGLVYPAIWITGMLARGALTGWYPYDFFDPSGSLGGAGVAMYILGIGGLCGLCLMLCFSVNRLRHPAREPQNS